MDVGCGPGSITLDLAEVVGAVVGLDASAEAIAAARRLDRAERVRWMVGDLTTLPFADGVFDVVYAHQVLQHVADRPAALAEARRVLRPGGLLAVRDADYGTMVHSPAIPALDQWRDLYVEVAREVGGEPYAGRFLAGWVIESGFEIVDVTTSTWTYADSDRVAAWRDLWIDRLLRGRLGRMAVETGRIDRAGLEDLVEGWRAWAAADHPFFAFLHGEVVAIAPR